jgi:hypothetical protein
MKLVYGIVLHNKFISDNMYVNVKNVSDGLYVIDVESDDYLKSISIADIMEFDKYVKKAKKMEYIYGLSFQDSFIPFNVIKWKKFPIKLLNSSAHDWEVVKVLHIIHRDIFYYVESVINKLSEKLFELGSVFERRGSLSGIKDVIPEMRILYSLHLFEEERKKIEAQKLAEAEFRKTVGGRLEYIITQSGGKLEKYDVVSKGYSVTWSVGGDKINTLIGKNFHVIEAGFCVSGYDRTQSMSSIVNLLKEYHDEGSHIVKQRSI